VTESSDMNGTSRPGMAKFVAGMIVAAMVAVVLLLGTLFSSLGPPVTSQSSSIVTQCALPASFASVSVSENVTLSGCLSPGASGTDSLDVTGPHAMNLTGTIAAQGDVSVTVTGASDANLTAPSAVMYSQNFTTLIDFGGLTLPSNTTYSFEIHNEAATNNTVTLALSLKEIVPTAGG
jgi:hypothetical protein